MSPHNKEIHSYPNEESIPLQKIVDFPSRSQVNGMNGSSSSDDNVFNDIDGTSDSLGLLDQGPKFSSDKSFKGKVRMLFYNLWNGPRKPEDKPPPQISLFRKLESLPEKINNNIPKKIRVTGLTFYLMFWFGLCYNILVPYFTVAPTLPNDHNVKVISLSCLGQFDFWRGKNGACGFNGELCPSINDGEEVLFRCPALCDRGSWTYSLVPIGDQRIKYRGYFVGGGDKVMKAVDKDQLTNPYRSDSFPCGAGVHAGIISPFFGGCARISYKSKVQYSFPSAPGHYGVSDSIEFLSFFRSSFFFKKLSGDGDASFTHCYDPRLIILLINIILGIPIVYLGSGAVIYWTISIVGFWTICLATDPPRTVDPSNLEEFANLISVGFRRFLPTCFILYVLWHCSVKRTLTDLPHELGMKPSPLSKLILWYPMLWLGILNNITFDRLPVDRLTTHDIQAQPGALLAVLSLITLIAICAVIQAYKIWLSGRFKKYLAIYSLFVLGLVLLTYLPGLSLRIHHYILAMLLIPGCATRGRTALLFQGILLGLFLSGASRWGLDAIVETAGALKRNDPNGEVPPPVFIGYNSSSGILSWRDHSKETLKPVERKFYDRYNGISILINDIEKYVGEKVDSINLKELFNNSRDLKKYIKEALKKGYKDQAGNILIYIRIGKKIVNSQIYSDFSNAAVLKWPSGEFTLPQPGVT